eukprot:CAMPEP_0113944984 /NCGR_PEP_ID=MMETSP1339-20121228/38412_1 /TAXON_ID=94617 /ORGANISM="Fibrocapsa japonica" /LENGTH=646 /DNA_ID=CAMNT_0000950367 /DNA_START=136 /DNA_END=2073 /DNA_ORIENTATION=+ /assembly_acc=CAM_ASM_000762
MNMEESTETRLLLGAENFKSELVQDHQEDASSSSTTTSTSSPLTLLGLPVTQGLRVAMGVQALCILALLCPLAFHRGPELEGGGRAINGRPVVSMQERPEEELVFSTRTLYGEPPLAMKYGTVRPNFASLFPRKNSLSRQELEGIKNMENLMTSKFSKLDPSQLEPEVLDGRVLGLRTADCNAPPAVIMGVPTDKSVTANMLADQDAWVQIMYADAVNPQAVAYTDPMRLLAHQPQPLTVEDLYPAAKYVYEVAFQYDAACPMVISQSNFFHTQRMFDETFRFAIIADTHTFIDKEYEEDTFRDTMSQIIHTVNFVDDIDFTFEMGDMFMAWTLLQNNPNENLHTVYENVFRLYSQLGQATPMFFVNGEREGETGYSFPMSNKVGLAPHSEMEAAVPVQIAKLRKQFLKAPLPEPQGFFSGNVDIEFESLGYVGNYYSYNWGNALFVTLDPYWYTRTKFPSTVPQDGWLWTLGKQQYEWLYSVLSTSQQKYKFIMIHQLVGGKFGDGMWLRGHGDERWGRYFEWGGLDPDTNQPRFEEMRPDFKYGPIHQILMDTGVNCVFRGHDHLYHVGALDGVVYNTLPKTSLNNDHYRHVDMEKTRIKGYVPEETIFNSGFSEVVVEPDHARVMFKSYTGELLSSFDLIPAW